MVWFEIHRKLPKVTESYQKSPEEVGRIQISKGWHYNNQDEENNSNESVEAIFDFFLCLTNANGTRASFSEECLGT